MKKTSTIIPILLLCLPVAAQQPDFSVFQESAISDIKAEGWMKKTLTTQRDGLTGHIEVAGHPFDKEGWGAPEDGNRGMTRWEDFEQTGYWADGALRLGYLIGDGSLSREVKDWIDYQISNPAADGYIGPELNNLWPEVVFFRAIMAEYSVSHDPRIIEALSDHYKNAEKCKLLIKTDGYDFDFNERTMLHIEMLCWLYRTTGDKFFIDKAEETYRIFCSQHSPFTMEAFASDQVPVVHSVSSSETLKIPILLYICTGRKDYLDAAIHGVKKVYAYHGLADGVPSGNEAHDWNRPNEVHETCAVSDFQWMLGYLLEATGDARVADLMERICFNAAMGVVSKDFKSLQYYSSPNQVIAKENSSPCTFIGGTDRMAYRVSHGPACCNGNMNRMIPLFCSRQWMKKGEDGIVAALYSPSTYTFESGNRKKQTVTIKEDTSYPFEESIRFSIGTEKPVRFSLWLRIPEWCDNAALSINGEAPRPITVSGTFIEIDRTFENGDTIELVLPMEARFTSMPYNGISVERGPLLFSLPVKSDCRTIETREHKGVEFHSYFMDPASKWNYSINNTSPLKVSDSHNYDNPWDIADTPVKIQVQATEIKNWQLYRGVFTPDIPSIINPGEQSWIELVPMGATYLRISVFPDNGKIPVRDI